jgi:hypothetical protein
MNSEPVLTARQQSALWYKNLTDKYPHHFTFVEAWNGEGTTDAQFRTMGEWVRAHAGEKDTDWTVNGSPIGSDCTYWFRDPETAMLFKLTFVGTHG